MLVLLHLVGKNVTPEIAWFQFVQVRAHNENSGSELSEFFVDMSIVAAMQELATARVSLLLHNKEQGLHSIHAIIIINHCMVMGLDALYSARDCAFSLSRLLSFISRFPPSRFSKFHIPCFVSHFPGRLKRRLTSIHLSMIPSSALLFTDKL